MGNHKDPFQFFPKLAKRHPEIAGVLSILILLILITVVYPALKILFESKSQPTDAEMILIVDALPTDGVYSNPQGAGGNYRDPLHGFFEVKEPEGFKGRLIAKKTSTTSIVSFDKENIEIRVYAEKMRGALSPTRPDNLYRERSVMIDGTQAIERLWVYDGDAFLELQYNKHGLAHRILIACPFKEFQENSDKILEFLRSYRSSKLE
jgi:hypothetical protein